MVSAAVDMLLIEGRAGDRCPAHCGGAVSPLTAEFLRGDAVINEDNHADSAERPFRILLVCEANVCRSPMAEYLLRKILTDQGVDASAFEVISAGIHADDGETMDPRTVEQLVRLDVSPNGFRFHTLTDGDLDDADLILTATRAQRSMLLERVPTALRRSFTMLEFAQTARQVRSRWPKVRDPKDLVRLTAATRGSVPVPEYDIADPVGGSVKVHRSTADVTLDAVQAISGALVRLPAS